MDMRLKCCPTCSAHFCPNSKRSLIFCLIFVGTSSGSDPTKLLTKLWIRSTIDSNSILASMYELKLFSKLSLRFHTFRTWFVCSKTALALLSFKVSFIYHLLFCCAAALSKNRVSARGQSGSLFSCALR